MLNDFTFAFIKPNAVKNSNIGPILSMINKAGFRISAMKMIHLTISQAESFYAVHGEKPFFRDLVKFMSSGPVVAMILCCDNAVEEFRKLIGETDPARAGEGTIRKLFATSLQMNAVHGSDSNENAIKEAAFFFSEFERYYS
ncbi:MAG TPA: nucleoside-diphosphate kinase [Bacteroidales bacterium]|nr:nucleoside-diphosphate kinase [Bacteroidales bacterium]